MATRTPKRSEWHQANGKWTRSLGERGTRVRLFQNRRNGVFHRDVFVPGQGRNRRSMHTRDRDEADRLGKQLLAALLDKGEVPVNPGPITLPEIWARYSTTCQAYLDNSAASRRDTVTRAAVLIGYFGRSKDVRTISVDDVARYARRRREGGISYTIIDRQGKPARRITGPAKERSAHADLVALRTMLRWACTVYSPSRGRWLDHNPLAGLRFAQEKNPLRPVATEDRYWKTREAIERLRTNAGSEQEREKWTRLELALYLAEKTGRRRGSIVGLRWEDLDFVENKITWRAEHDKKGVEWIRGMPLAVMKELLAFKRELAAVEGHLFPMQRDSGRPIPEEMLSQWLDAAEKEAGVPKLAGGVWHPYRRKWASERSHFPIKAVAEAGGWKDVTTLMRCYQHADEETLLAVMEGPEKKTDTTPVSAQSLGVLRLVR
jgi:integrase